MMLVLSVIYAVGVFSQLVSNDLDNPIMQLLFDFTLSVVLAIISFRRYKFYKNAPVNEEPTSAKGDS